MTQALKWRWNSKMVEDDCPYNSDPGCECDSDIDEQRYRNMLIAVITDNDGDGISENGGDDCPYTPDPGCEHGLDLDDGGICDSDDTDSDGDEA